MKIGSQILDSGRIPAGAAAIAAALLLSACGQKGPLYLPTGDAAVGRATLPQTLRPSTPVAIPEAPTPAAPSPSSATAPVPPAPPATGAANPIHSE